MKDETVTKLLLSKVTNKAGEELFIIKVNNDDILEDVYIVLSNNKTVSLLMTFEKGILMYSNEIKQLIENEISDYKKALEEAEKVEEESAKSRLITSPSKHKKSIDEMFGENYHVEYLKRFPILTYEEVEIKHDINIRGFGRGINKNDSGMILISTIGKKDDKFTYHDYWLDADTYKYSGEGQIGDQKQNRGNGELANLAGTDAHVHLYVKFSPSEYYYQGEFRVDSFSTEKDFDSLGQIRDEFKFILKRI